MEELTYIRKSIEGDGKSQKYLFDKYSAPMLKLCKRYLIDDYESEEAFITAFRKAFEKLDSLKDKDEKSFNKWLSRIMINECLMILRKSHHLEKVREDHTNIATESIHTHDSEYIYQLILELPLGYRTVFNLFAIEGYNHKEISEMLDISEGTSRSQLSKAREILKKRIKNLNERNGTY